MQEVGTKPLRGTFGRLVASSLAGTAVAGIGCFAFLALHWTRATGLTGNPRALGWAASYAVVAAIGGLAASAVASLAALQMIRRPTARWRPTLLGAAIGGVIGGLLGMTFWSEAAGQPVAIACFVLEPFAGLVAGWWAVPRPTRASFG